MTQDVINRLASFGYVSTSDDAWLLDFIVRKVECMVKDTCLVDSIPQRLLYAATDMAVAQFLLEKKTVAPDSLTNIDFQTAIKSIQEGDTSISYAIGDGCNMPEQRLDFLIQSLQNSGRGVFNAHRCVKW